eukprot:CAMPEP_0197614644 /NCGR_PEP_ID=MMETSP1326-20131121/59629_1 /TAXON_ID=1155430 /ORGANISM="Genus nov. species nov., Strain RCC2288" /LENGTH=409 /DNA_ID=CAMNT_0043183517 /DNA_START=185 /DNA_END=1414 /DNA_ORIENTATION=+
MGILEKIKDIELEMSRTQKNKATEGHLGVLKSKLAKYRTMLLAPVKVGSGEGEGFEVSKYGHGRVALIGFPSVGKSTLLSQLTSTESEVAAYEFTTLTCIPGVIHYQNAKIQLLDLPGIIEGASEGKGRGRQVIAVAKSSDLILMILDATKSEAANSQYAHKEILTRELEAVGLRLNQAPPRIYIKPKHQGGTQINNTVAGGLTKMTESTILKVLAEYKIHHCELLFREDCTVDQLIDALEGNRKYIRCLYVYNKVDVLTIEEVDSLSKRPDSVCISCFLELGYEPLLRRMWDSMGLVRVYTKKTGNKPDFVEPVVLADHRGGCSVKQFCNQISTALAKQLKYAQVWGTSTKHMGQRVGVKHTLQDEDVVQIVKGDKSNPEDLAGRFSTTKRNDPARIADRVKKAKLKS